jgi:hypothetical protein
MTLLTPQNFPSTDFTPPTIKKEVPTVAPGPQSMIPNQSLIPTTSTSSSSPVVPAPKPTPTVTQSTNGFILNSDGTTNYQATLDAIKKSALDLQEKAKGLASQNDTAVVTTPTKSSVVSSSAPVIAQENKVISDLQAMTSDDAAITQAHNDYLAQLKAEEAALEQRRINEEAQINASFDTKKTQTEQAQKGEKGTFTSTLARIGGYLGDSASATGAIVNLNQTHQFQLSDLEAKRQGALQEARNAITDKQFALARLKTEEAKDYAKAISDSKQKFFENNLKILNEQRQQDAQSRLEIKDKLANLAYLTPDQISPETKKEIDSFYGTPGFTENYINVTNQAQKAKTEKDIMDARKATLEFLQNIPAGQKIQFPDGTEYTGMGKAGDVATFMQVDSAGNGHLITYNKLTGAKNITNLGVVGKGSGGGSGTSIGKTDPVVIDNAVNIFQTSLEAAKDKTGQYDPDVYLKLRNQLKESQNPQLVPYMDKLFLNKNNEFFSEAAINRLRSKGVYFGDVSLPPEPNLTDATGNDITAGE